jgi:hypothetical protein
VPLILLTLGAMTAALFAPTSSDWDKGSTALIDRLSMWNLVEAAIAIWSFVISVQTLAEVHRFSTGRALGAKAVGALAIAFVGLGIFIVMTLIALIASIV